jgi:hypothetical protein
MNVNEAIVRVKKILKPGRVVCIHSADLSPDVIGAVQEVDKSGVTFTTGSTSSTWLSWTYILHAERKNGVVLL